MNLKDILTIAVRAIDIPMIDEDRDGKVSLEEINFGLTLLTDKIENCEGLNNCDFYREKQNIFSGLKADIQRNGAFVYFRGFDLGSPNEKARIRFADLPEDRRKVIVASDAYGDNDGRLSIREAVGVLDKAVGGLNITTKSKEKLIELIRAGRTSTRVASIGNQGGGRYIELSVSFGKTEVPFLALTEDLDLIMYYPDINPKLKYLLEKTDTVGETIDDSLIASFDSYSKIRIAIFVEANFSTENQKAKKKLQDLISKNEYLPISCTAQSITVLDPKDGIIKHIDLNFLKDELLPILRPSNFF